MSRAYRIKVRETLRRVLKAKDGVSTQLELLEILSPEEMAGLLGAELERRGYERRGKTLQRQLAGVTVSVDPATGTVKVQAECCEDVELEDDKEGRAYDDVGPGRKAAEKQLRESLRKDLERKADKQEAQLQSQVTDQLEAQLGELRQELDQVVNKVTAEALKRKAAQLGEIKEVTEDEQSGSLTIVLEV